MSTVISVRNLPLHATEEAVHSLFSAYGTVAAMRLITEHATGRLRSFACVAMADGTPAVLAALNQTDLGGQPRMGTLATLRAAYTPRPCGW